jgi:endo-1,4-beta-D-glucanase Y
MSVRHIHEMSYGNIIALDLKLHCVFDYIVAWNLANLKQSALESRNHMEVKIMRKLEFCTR